MSKKLHKKVSFTNKYCLSAYIVFLYHWLSVTGCNNIHSNDLYINFNNPQEIPYLWKKVTTAPYSTWTLNGFDKNKKSFWIKYYKRPIAYMFYKLIKIDRKNFYKLTLGYQTKYDTYFSVYLKYIDKNFKQRGYQIVYKNKLSPQKKSIEIEFKPAKKIKKAILYISILYIKRISKLYLKYLSLSTVDKIYSNLDDLHIIPYKENINLKICYKISRSYDAKLKFSFINILSKQVELISKESVITKKTGCIKNRINLSSGIYLFEYSLSSANNSYRRNQVIWVTSYLYYIKKYTYTYNTTNKLYLPTIPFISFLNFNQKLPDNIILEPFLPDNIFSQYYPVTPAVFLRSNFSTELLSYMKENYDIKNIFLILNTNSNSIGIQSILQYSKSLRPLANVFFIRQEDLSKKVFETINSSQKNNFIFINDYDVNNFYKIHGKKIVINYDNFVKFIPIIFLNILTRHSVLLNEPYFSEEYQFFINKDKTITIVKYSENPIDNSMFPIQKILIDRSFDLGSFGYKTNKKIYILKFQGELPSSIQKTINNISIFPRTFFAPINTINANITIENFFNESVVIKHLTIETDKEWEISIQTKTKTIKIGQKVNIPFIINLPSIIPLRRYTFSLKLKLSHSKVGDIEINKLFSLSIKNREFSVKNKIQKEDKGINVILTFKNKKSKTSAYHIVVVQPPQLLKQETAIKLLPKKKEVTYIKLTNYRRGKPLILSIKNILTGNIFFLELTPKY